MQGAEIQDGLSPPSGPAHARLFQSLLDNVSSRRFNLSGTDGQRVTQGPRVVEPIAILFEVLQQSLRTDFHISGGVPSGQPLQGGEEIRLLPPTSPARPKAGPVS